MKKMKPKYFNHDDNQLVEDFYTCPDNSPEKSILREKLIEHYHPLCRCVAVNMYKKMRQHTDYDSLYSHAQLSLVQIIDDQFRMEYKEDGTINSLCTYIYTKLGYMIIDEVRKETHCRAKYYQHPLSMDELHRNDDDDVAMPRDPKSMDWIKKVDNQDFWEFLQTFLKPRQYLYLYHYYKLGYTMAEIATMTKRYSEPTISVHIGEALARIKEEFPFAHGQLCLSQKVG